ncbi:uncharacterized protein LOC135372796 [Ornithodoros turicata]|uniref:uncharacterized protein LOC135372796 n=1 Tax=Ornithodoros turicata TaxID=34597 RepID=UPI00313A3DEA
MFALLPCFILCTRTNGILNDSYFQSGMCTQSVPVCDGTNTSHAVYNTDPGCTIQGQSLFSSRQGATGAFPPVMATVGSEVHLGHGIFIPHEKLEWMMKAATDSRFLRGITRALWSPEELKGRSVTGKPCQRSLKDGCNGKRALTPRKLAALTNAFEVYVENNTCPKGTAASERLRKKNRLLADYLKTM